MTRPAAGRQPQPDGGPDEAAEATVPGCDTGPAGRVGFVVRELRQVWRDRRRPPAHGRREGRER